MMRPRWFALLLASGAAAAWMLFLLDAQGAGTCRITDTPVRFGVYNPISSAEARATGSIVYNCSAATPITISINRGRSNNFRARKMVAGASSLEYNLFLDAAATMIWGDGTGGSETYRATARPNTNTQVPVFGRMPGSQSRATAGQYADTLVVTITF